MKDFSTPLEAFNYWLAQDPNHVFLRQPINRKFIEYTRAEVFRQASKIASSLHDLGLNRGDHVALLSKNCAHWFMADLAMMIGGFISIPLYPTLDKDSINEILIHSESKAIIIGKLDNYDFQKEGIPDIPKIGVRLYGIEEEHVWEELVLKEFETFEPVDQDPESIISIMYTSGTTGNPKGVMHKVKSFNLVASVIKEVYEIPPSLKLFSYLPLSHVAERIAIEMSAFYNNATVTFPESLDTFAEDLAWTCPDIFVGVPRIWQKFQEKILEKVPQRKLDTLLSIPILSGIVKKSIQKKLGLKNAIFCASGAAPLAVSLQEWYGRLGIQIIQSYGMTEDCILSHFNIPSTNRFGTVGRPLPHVQSKLSAEGEILVKNPCLMIGYYKEPEKTAEMFTEEGFLRTGDIGEFDHDGYLHITGRIKDQFKTDKGKYVSPAAIELELSKNEDIEQVCVVGMGIAQPMALIIPSEAGRKKEKMEFEKSILKTIDDLNPTLKSHEKLAKAVVMKEEWSVDNGLMTPSLKIRRNRVESIHQHMYRTWFDSDERIVYEKKIG